MSEKTDWAKVEAGEVARRMKVKPPAMSRLERFGAGAIWRSMA